MAFIPPEAPNPSIQPDRVQPDKVQPDKVQPDIAEPDIALAPSRRLPGWRLWVPLAFQTVLILAAPAQNTYTYVSGKTVTLQTVPVDPYDVLRGYSQTLSYSISDPALLGKLPGGTWFSQHSQEQNASFYIVLEAPVSEAPVSETPSKTNAASPQAWKPVKISSDRPANLPSNQVALKGEYKGGQVVYGLETYYMPEDQREQINGDIRQAQGQTQGQAQGQAQQTLKVDAKVDSSGNAILMNLWISDRKYE